MSFVLIGVASTVAYVLLYLLLRGALAAQAANAVGLLLTAVANTAVNRRVTFGIRGRRHAARHQVRGLIAFAIGLALTSGALAALHASAPQAGRTAELTVLVVANLTATLVRFGLYRTWVFRHPRPGSPPGGHPAPPGCLGNFSMLAMLLNTFQVDLQAVEPPFPDVRGFAHVPGEQAAPEA